MPRVLMIPQPGRDREPSAADRGPHSIDAGQSHVRLYASGISATFDNVVVTPEPAAMSTFSAAAGTLLLRRRRGPRG